MGQWQTTGSEIPNVGWSKPIKLFQTEQTKTVYQRNIQNEDGATEEIYLEPLSEILAKKRTPSDELIHEFSNDWSKNIKSVYNKNYL